MEKLEKSANLLQLIGKLRFYKKSILLFSVATAVAGLFYSASKPISSTSTIYKELAVFPNSKETYIDIPSLSSKIILSNIFKSNPAIKDVKINIREDYANFIEIKSTCLNADCVDYSNNIIEIINKKHASDYKDKISRM